MKRVLLFLGIIFSALSVYADDNVLQTIEIESVKDTYNIVLISDKAVDVKKVVQAPNKITLTLKDIRASKSLNTVYNNVSNVDTVMVEPTGGGLSIFFQAENASASTVTFDTLAPAAPLKDGIVNLQLNNPIESYAPIYSENGQTEKSSGLLSRFKNSQIADSISDIEDEHSASDTVHKFFSFGIAGLLAFAVFRLLKRREPEIKIGLSGSLNDREIGMYRGQTASVSNMNAEKPFTTVNYGLNAYRKENVNPYETEPLEFHNPQLRNYVSQMPQNTITQTIERPAHQPLQAASAVQTQVKKHTTPVNVTAVNLSNPNVDNLKFLESMTAIYEKSGRHDLAMGLQASLNKNNLK